MRNLAVIPARGGSKRIPQKNIKYFLGKPIIAYSIEAALQSELFEEVLVSTDSEEIAEVAISYGAKVRSLRTAKNADDQATISDVMSEVLSNYGSTDYDHLCLIFATAPFVNAEILKRGLEKLRSGDYHSIVPVQAFNFPIFRSLKITDEDYLALNWPEYAKTRSQDLPDSYHDAGQFYWAKFDAYLEEKKFYSAKAGHLILESWEAQDIDTPEDWKMAELKYKMLNNND